MRLSTQLPYIDFSTLKNKWILVIGWSTVLDAPSGYGLLLQEITVLRRQRQGFVPRSSRWHDLDHSSMKFCNLIGQVEVNKFT